MDTVTLAHAKEHLEDLISRAQRGDDVRIVDARGGAIRLVPAEGCEPAPQNIIFGQWKHLREIPMERLLAPLSEDELAWLSGENSAVE